MAIWLWLAKMDRPLSENEYHDMLELLPEDRRLRLERIPREKHQEVLCAYLLLRLALHDRYSWRTLPVISTEASALSASARWSALRGCGHRRLFLDAGCGGRPG